MMPDTKLVPVALESGIQDECPEGPANSFTNTSSSRRCPVRGLSGPDTVMASNESTWESSDLPVVLPHRAHASWVS